MGLKEILESIGGAGNAVNTAAALGLGTAGLALAEKGYSDLGDIGERAYAGLAGEGGLAEQLRGMLEFQPYTVTSATGGQFGMTQDPTTGQMTYQMATSPEEQALQQQTLANAGMFFNQAAMPVDQREQDIFQRMRTAMSPEEERQRLEMEQRMAAQGRLGVRTAQFGGTPEQLALAKAQEEARNTAMLNAMQFAGQEQQRQAQLGTGMLVCWLRTTSTASGCFTARNDCSRTSASVLVRTSGSIRTDVRFRSYKALLQSALGQANIAGGVGGNIASAALGGLFG